MNTRQEILEYLSRHTHASAEDLAQVLAKTRANIQYHLKHLEQAGVIIPVYPEGNSSERGRPRRFFSLSQTEKPDNLAILADALLNLLQQQPTLTPAQSTPIAEIARNIVKLPGIPSLATARLNRLVRELSNYGYQARWEAHAFGPEIVFRNCPYAALLPAHPELCQMDKLILENHLGHTMDQKTRIHLPSIPACRFTNDNSG